MSLRIGEFEAQSVSGGMLSLDGGTMFGLVPKAVWSRRVEADEKNRIRLATNCMLIRTPAKMILVDTGYGTKHDERFSRNHGLEAGDILLDSLAAVDISPSDIDVVIFTHLHFDHAGGATRFDDSGKLCPTFPRARHVIQRAEWEDAMDTPAEVGDAYAKQEMLVLENAGLVDVVEGDCEPWPGIRLQLTAGHTRGHQIIHIVDGGEHAVYPADICPTSTHLRALWSMSYDQCPLVVRRVKPQVFGQAADEGWTVLFEHDPNIRAARIRRDEKQEFVVSEELPL